MAGRPAYAFLLPALMGLAGCAALLPVRREAPSAPEREAAARVGLTEEQLAAMRRKPLYRFTEQEVDRYLRYLHEVEPDLRARVQHLARKMVGQPYKIFLLGEFPFELYDPEPLYSLRQSDCLVFAEHMYAMALARDWSSFIALLQRIRYRDGRIGMLTRNHYTEADWVVNNSWLVEDLSSELVGDRAVPVTSVIDRARFFRRFGLGQDIPPQELSWSYIPYELVPEIADRLQPGDFVNIVRGNEDGLYVGHVGLITRGQDGTVYLLHSTSPRVVEEPLLDLCREAPARRAAAEKENARIVARNREIQAHNDRVRQTGKGKEKPLLRPRPYFYGFRFYRLRPDALEELRRRDGPDAPRVQFVPNAGF